MGVICDKSTATLYPDLTKKYLITKKKNGFFIAVAEKYLYSYEPTWQKITTCTHHRNQKSLDKKHRYTSVSISVRQKIICVKTIPRCLIYNNMHVWFSKKKKKKKSRCFVGNPRQVSYVYPNRPFANLLNLSRFHEYFLFSIQQWNSEALRFWIWKRRSCYKHAILKRRMGKH